ncbi:MULTISPECIES: ATP-binding protein [Azorhizobium]|uniref:Putative anti-sigma factor n=1 Tax=Azorhizobium caulinodans (strain ATCC 43989 / DSM 5975 / JCM 20966 / LMG 6465 / NBRC 14845 / NCIMB 13405 / ORS 571) TaxID=438753 RepID=A8HST6_AZOC5|nr:MULTISPECIES: ATP-binding protein [Azorhizobium]TDT89391.1 anti-sigma regulatory factor (Ser/Thr protein kinase) [Azorhizobium sp. AG788]BAF90213.1 putative anti-sigma factor [Azorhizobium caulinodans ORS 571]
MSLPDGAVEVASLAVEASLEELPRVAEWLAERAEADNWPDRIRFGLDLSLEEALVNVISYGFEGLDHPPRIRLDYFHLPEGRFALRIVDNGVPFDPLSVGEPEAVASVDEARIGGHGVQLMRHFLSDLAYERVGEENRFLLVADPSKAA